MDLDLWDVYLDLHNQLTLPFKASCPFLKLQHKGEVEFKKCNFLIVERKRERIEVQIRNKRSNFLSFDISVLQLSADPLLVINVTSSRKRTLENLIL